MKEPELVLKARDAMYERKGRAILKDQIHQKITDVMRNHGDEVVFGGVDDYVLKEQLKGNGVDYVLNCHTQGRDNSLPFTSFSFESPTIDRTLFLTEEREDATVANTTYGLFAKICRQRSKNRDKHLKSVDFRSASTHELIQFAELVDLLAEEAKNRVGLEDPIGFLNRMDVA